MATRNEILQELAEMNSPLADCSRTMPFDVPEGYFENLPGTMLQRAERNVAPAREAMPHIVPEGYFENLPEEVMRKLVNEGRKKMETSISPKRTRWLPGLQWAAAAILVLAVGLGAYRFLNPARQTVEQQLQAISDEALMSYVEDNLYAFETVTIAEHIGTTGINSSPLNLNDEAIEDYLEEAGWQ